MNNTVTHPVHLSPWRLLHFVSFNGSTNNVVEKCLQSAIYLNKKLLKITVDCEKLINYIKPNN